MTNPTNVSTRSKQHGYVDTLQPRRTVKYYSVADHELHTISAFNSWATLCYSASTFFLSIGFGIWSNIFAASNPSDLIKDGGRTLELICFIVAGVAFGLGCVATQTRRSTLKSIKAAHGDDVTHPAVKTCRWLFGSRPPALGQSPQPAPAAPKTP